MVASRGRPGLGTWCGQLLKTGEDEGTDAGALSGAGELVGAGKGDCKNDQLENQKSV